MPDINEKRNITPAQVVQKLIRSSFFQVKPDGKTKDVKTRYLGFLLLESMCAFRKNPSTFGSEPRSFNAAMKKSMKDYVLTGTRDQRAARLRRLDDIIKAYKAPLGARSKIARTRIGGSTLPVYLRRKAAGIFMNSVADMQKQRIGTQLLIPAGVSIPEPKLNEQWLCRRLQGRLMSIYCVNRSDVSADELYLMTGEMLVDSTGAWDTVTHPPSDVFSSPENDQRVTLPTNPYWLHDWQILNPPDTYSVLPLTALCNVTLMEEDFSVKERVYSAFKAAYKTAYLLATIGGTGPVGIATALVGIFIDFLVALDGDDHLGTAPFRFDNILSDEVAENYVVELPIGGPHGDSDCRYLVKVNNRSTNYECPMDPPFRIEGPTKRTMRYRGDSVRGGYRLVAPFPIKENSIRWSASPAGATVAQQGRRYTSINFSAARTYTVKVEAERVDGQQVSSVPVTVTVELREGGYLEP